MVLKPDIRGLIFDLDNTLYKNPEGKDAVFSAAAAFAAIDLGVGLTFEDAQKLAESSYRDHKSESAVFCRDYGLLEKDFHYAAHKRGVDLMMRAVPPVEAFKAAFNRLACDYDVRIVTHGSQYWAEQFISHLGYAPSLENHQIMGLDHPDIGYRTKDAPEVFKTVAEMMNLHPEQIAVVEDTAKNLVSPYALGMQTVFTHWGNPLNEQPVYITHQVPDFSAL